MWSAGAERQADPEAVEWTDPEAVEWTDPEAVEWTHAGLAALQADGAVREPRGRAGTAATH